jgi:uncharacterized protein Yka (UPF0111/DUF47 family)
MSEHPRALRRRWWNLLLPAAPDVLGLLLAQGDLTASGMAAFDRWSRTSDGESAAAVRTAQHQAYDARRALLKALQAALSTPVDQEDIYVLSERVDRILTDARNALREAEILGWAPDAHAGAMSERLLEGTQALVTGFKLLRKNPQEAGRRADAASEAVHHVEGDYRRAMADLVQVDDLRAVLAAQDVYRRYLHVAEAIVAVADRLWYIVLRGA